MSQILNFNSRLNNETKYSSNYSNNIKLLKSKPQQVAKPNKSYKKQFSKLKYNPINIFMLPGEVMTCIRTFSPKVHTRSVSNLSNDYIIEARKADQVKVKPLNKPSDSIIRQNDKKMLLPTEFQAKYYTLSKNSSACDIAFTRRNYPYAKDNVGGVIKHKNLTVNYLLIIE